jgi:hypothetical protein
LFEPVRHWLFLRYLIVHHTFSLSSKFFCYFYYTQCDASYLSSTPSMFCSCCYNMPTWTTFSFLVSIAWREYVPQLSKHQVDADDDDNRDCNGVPLLRKNNHS